MPRISRASRRRVIVIAGSAIAASILPRQLAQGAYPALSDEPPPDEGYFFILPGKNAGGDDLEGDRVFFISSSWLPLFEVTDHLSKRAKKGTVNIAAGTPAVVTWTGHGLDNDNKVRFSGSEPLPDPIKSGETYFVRNKTANNFKIADKSGNLVNTTTPASATATQVKKSETLKHLKHHGKGQKDWVVLYSDDINSLIEKNTTAPIIPLPEPPEGKTYLAMSIK